MTIGNRNIKVIIPLLLAVMLAAGIIIGNRLNFGNYHGNFGSREHTNKIDAILQYIENEYVDSLSPDTLIESVIPYMLKHLDPHSVYIPANEFKASEESLEGNFEGIGVQFNVQGDTVVVINTVAGGPAEKAGVRAGDRIVKVNDSLIAGKKISSDAVMKKLKGPRGIKVKISVKRSDIHELVDITITRDKIPLVSVDVAYMLSGYAGYIKISKFSRTTHNEFTEAVKTLHKQGMTKLMLDLRGNGGGYMEVATQIADEFLDAGRVIVYTAGKARPKTVINSKPGGVCLKDKLVILIDEWSASASEILAGAIQDNDRGTIIGRRSYGKGLVQEQNEFPDGSALRLTVARYYTPTGRCIQKPYNHGQEDYFSDLNKRFLHGELEQKDSIRFPDSLKFITPGGKVVYGGGGIMPDIFVPADTTGMNGFMSKISNKGFIYQFAFRYTDENRSKLSGFKDYRELESWLDKQDIRTRFLSFCAGKGVKPSPNEIAASGKLMFVQLKALISRNIFDDKGFYPILGEIDKTLITAREILDK
ncbi:MAG: S41 family peptidase [Bacteroidia bacterium]|nr:S41 family peptidase [Bacteroidia bacterium]